MNITVKPISKGKVRDIYDLGDKLLMVATDRISAFDYILPSTIPHKGEVLTRLSCFWFDLLSDICENHLISTDVNDLPTEFNGTKDYLRGRIMIVKKAEMEPVECIVRAYLVGSGLVEYKRSGSVCGIQLPSGLVDSSKLPENIYTPSTKAVIGDHDENISYEKSVEILGKEKARALRDASLKVFARASEHAESRGIIIADTKFEFGYVNGVLTLCDEVLTPDSSRLWSKSDYEPGRNQASFDKQFVRDWLNVSWERKAFAATGEEFAQQALPVDIIKKTSEKYIQAYELITGKDF
ncbi:MAG: phosphoribosylaminoimidazolesuccinocarboxamide synthase [Eggerthellaceae bacterium]|nr:phosphoribosylaminoimidazolesuccinocarboxamide synthase [Eggerthellaceae bacterium]